MLLALFLLPGCVTTGKDRSFTPLDQVHDDTRPELEAHLQEKGLRLGAPVFIRAFKSEMQMEVWVKNDSSGQYDLFKTYPICRASGTLGPKTREGDKQAPEGFYDVSEEQLNPNSKFYLSFNLGYPNTYDRAHKRTGSALMIHGNCVSAGCLAMTDRNIGEIYLMVEESLKGNDTPVPVHIFPFRMTDEQMALRRYSQWYPFWANLKEGYDFFEMWDMPPQVETSDKRYVFDMNRDAPFTLSAAEQNMLAVVKSQTRP